MKEDSLWIIPVVIFAAMVGAIIGASLQEHEDRIDVVRHHAAHYDSHTGKWQWNDDVKP